MQPAGHAAEPKQIPFWNNGARRDNKPQDEPVLFLSPAADVATAAAVIVCPGGGYGRLAMEKKGATSPSGSIRSASPRSCSAIVTATPATDVDADARRTAGDSHRAGPRDQWGLDPKKIGVMGFSAGGHLASTLGTHFDAGNPEAGDAIDHASSRPDFMILCYPVISLTADYTHTGSRDNLLGINPDPPGAQPIERISSHERHAARVFVPHRRRPLRTNREQRRVLFGAAERGRAGRAAHLPERRPRRRHGTDIPGTRDWSDRCRARITDQILHR